jgi:hypothetical protein
VPKNATNPFFDSRYADLFSIKAICDPVLHDQGLVVTQFPGGGESGHCSLITRLAHVATGEFMEAEAHLPLAKEDPQALGSAITYMRRYAYCAILGIVADPDDDANGASRAPTPPGAPRTRDAGEQGVANAPPRPAPPAGYEEVNGELIPLGYSDEPIVRRGPGGTDATSVTEKQSKMLYAMTKTAFGGDCDVKAQISSMIGRPIKRTEEVTVTEFQPLVDKLKAAGA